ELYIPIELFDRIVFDEAVAAMNLESLVGDFHGHFGRKQFRHSGFFRDPPPRVFSSTRAVSKPTGGFNIGGHGRELVLNGLKLGDEAAKLLSMLGILQCRVKRALRGAD